MNSIFSKTFFITLFVKQNKWHNHSVLGHTLKVTYMAIRMKEYRFIIPALFHDVGKPYSAFQDDGDVKAGTYSFTNHEELSWHIIKNYSFLSDWSKNIVRHHYLIRSIHKSSERGHIKKLARLKRRWDSLSPELQADLKIFLRIDDAGK